MKKTFYISIFAILLITPLIFAGTYGSGTYGSGLYGTGEAAATPTPSPTPSSGGGGSSSSSSGGGGGGGIFQAIIGGFLNIDPEEPVISVIENVKEEREIVITNLKDETLLIKLDLSGKDLREVLTMDEEILLGPKESKPLKLSIKLENKNLVIGKILLKNPKFTREIPIVISSKSENFLFDVSILLENKFKTINKGNELKAQFDLLQIGVKEKVDVVGKYTIKDFEGNNYYEETETFFVLNEKSYIKEFPTQELKEGKYVLAFEISYPGAFAVSSVQFSVKERKIEPIYIIISLSVLFIITLIFIGIRFRKKTKSQIKMLHKSKKNKK